MNKKYYCLQEPPRYYGYWRYYYGGYACITKCNKCGNVGLREDCNPVNPCKHCGGEVHDCGAGKWIPPIYKACFFGKKIISHGYWNRA